MTCHFRECLSTHHREEMLILICASKWTTRPLGSAKKDCQQCKCTINQACTEQAKWIQRTNDTHRKNMFCTSLKIFMFGKTHFFCSKNADDACSTGTTGPCLEFPCSFSFVFKCKLFLLSLFFFICVHFFVWSLDYFWISL